jgi:hypothetical protein
MKKDNCNTEYDPWVVGIALLALLVCTVWESQQQKKKTGDSDQMKDTSFIKTWFFITNKSRN